MFSDGRRKLDYENIPTAVFTHPNIGTVDLTEAKARQRFGRLRVELNDCSCTTMVDGLNCPTAVAVGRDGAIYVTNNGVTAGPGQVLRILVP